MVAGARHVRALLVSLVVVLVAAGCVGSRPVLGEPQVRSAAGDPTTTEDLVARVPGLVDVFADADLSGTASERASGVDPTTTDRESVVRVIARTNRSVQVVLGDRSTGWVARSAVELLPAEFALVIDLAEGTVTIPEEDAVTVPARFGAGIADDAGGRIHLADLLQLPAQPPTPWGQVVFVLAGSTLTEENLLAGQAITAIVEDGGGTLPDGAVALAPADFARLRNLGLPLGTPVDLRRS